MKPLPEHYRIDDASRLITPALVIFHELVERNIAEMIRIAGDVRRLRPHCKTHKMPEMAKLELAAGIRKGKCATFAEAEMLADAGVPDIFLAYNLVGANIPRAVAFRRRYPQVVFSVTADHEGPIAALGQAMSDAGLSIEVLLDIDTGQHRTGVPAGPAARRLYERIANTPGLVAGGLHVYDGHNHQKTREERTTAVHGCWSPVKTLRDELVAAGLNVPRVVAGGTGSFPIFAAIPNEPTMELSPGTIVFHDVGYGETFSDLNFTPAALILTRVISRPTPDRVTLDLGYKAIASDPPAGNRLALPALPDAKAVLQNEEHLVIETASAAELQPGDELLAIPRHVCPTSALHKQAFVIRDHRIAAVWDVTARDRQLTV